jgi:hypothetical protein
LSKEIAISSVSKKLVEEAVLEEMRGEEGNNYLKESWIKLGNQLEIDGVPKDQICTVAAELLVAKKAEQFKIPKNELRMSGYFYRVFAEHSWTNKFFARNSSTVPLGEQENSSLNTPYYEENKPIIEIIHRLRKHLGDILGFYEENPHMSELEGDVRKNIRKSIHLMNQHIMIAEKIYNRKEKVPANLQHVLLYLLVTEGSVNDAARAFLQKRDELLEFTSKQAGKLQSGSIPDLLPILKPYTRDIAIFLGYFGVQCPHCSSWEVKEKPGSGIYPDLECWNCDGPTWKAKTLAKCSYCQIPLYEEYLAYLVKTGKCKHCKNTIEYPQELIKDQFDMLLARLDTVLAFSGNKSITEDQKKSLSQKLEKITAQILV